MKQVLRVTDRAAEGVCKICIIQQRNVHFKVIFLPFFSLWVKVRSFALLLQGQKRPAFSFCTLLWSFLWLGMDVFTTGLVFKATGINV